MDKEIVLTGLTGAVSALDLGSSDAPPIIALHGWLDNAASFIPLTRHLPDYRWICVDLPGHGKSDHRPKGCVYHFTDYVADLYLALKDIGLEQCDLAGHSLGAGIAATFAAVFPDMVNRLVLIDGIGPFYSSDIDALTLLRKSMTFIDQNRPHNPRVYGSWEALVTKRMAAGEIKRSSAELLLNRGCTREDDRIIVMSDSRLKQPSPIYMNQKKVSTILKGIAAPTLLVVASDGLIGNRPSTAQSAKAVSNLKQVAVSGGHHVHMDNPKPVAVEIERFFNQKSSAR